MASIEETQQKSRITGEMVCQMCNESMTLHSSVFDITPSCVEKLSQPPSTGSFPGLYKLPTEEKRSGFLVINSEDTNLTPNVNHRVEVVQDLCDIMAGYINVDFPLCEDCTDNMLIKLDSKLKTINEECESHREYIEMIGNSVDDVNFQQLDAELAELKIKEKTLLDELSKIEAENKEVDEEIRQKTAEGDMLRDEEERYLRKYCNHKKNMLYLDDEQKSLENQVRYSQHHLSRLKSTNVLNATFYIWHNGHFGTINGFRLGRLPDVPVEWAEINAAWGQSAFLLHCLASRVRLAFADYRLVPFGSHSYLESYNDRLKELPLYGSGGIKFLWDTKFDQAMVAFLDCLEQLNVHISSMGLGFSLPYKMEKGKIKEDLDYGKSYSIKIQFNTEEEWTKALKFMLTNMRWALTRVATLPSP